ncbi:adhesion G protein-coupled receptor B1-like isoform X2 [Crassostrea virginica]|uniref:Adhesion G-protein coupled receptor D1-like isoform X2 n=1 Tax=Crassostrea virginica TaxID=6565 RepID=A0A8B8AQI6_CRAVI|nr:adhesion G-protein coupled receptor D1-like isoform X2 [Crassostrea virginica]
MWLLERFFYFGVSFFILEQIKVQAQNGTVKLWNTVIDTYEGAEVITGANVNFTTNPATLQPRWSRNGRRISNTSRFKITDEFQPAYLTSTLTIKNVKRLDAGNWTFEVNVRNQSYSRIAFVTVHENPVLRVQRDFLVVQEGFPIYLVCYWTNNGKENYYKQIYLRSFTNTDAEKWIDTSNFDKSYSVFMKLKAEVKDSGDYTCYNTESNEAFSKQSGNIYIYVFKPDEVVCLSIIDEYGISWPNTLSNITVYGPCAEDKSGYSVRYCDLDAIWSYTDISYCSNGEYDLLEQQLDDIYSDIDDGLANETIVGNAIYKTLSEIKTVSRNTNSSGGLNRTIQMLGKIVDLANNADSLDEESFFQTVDNVLSSRNTDALTKLSKTENVSDAGTVMQLIEQFSGYVKRKGWNSTITKRFYGTNFEVGYSVLNSSASITFPQAQSGLSYLELPKQGTNKSDNFYTAVIYRTLQDFLPTNLKNVSRNQTEKMISTPVLSLKLETVPEVLSPPLSLTFVTLNKTGKSSSALCVYWDFTARNGRGAWQTDGCTRIDVSSNQIVCQCNHLTNFAVLMSLDSGIADAPVLSTISMIGSGISIFFAILTIVLHLVVWRFVKNDVTILLLNLCAALAVSYTLFMVESYATENKDLCAAITCLLHSMLLVMFSMMQCIGIHYFRNIFLASIWLSMADQFSQRSSLPWYLSIGWGLPFVISLMTLGIFVNKNYFLSNHCWLSVDSGSLYFFIVPAYLIIFLNTLILIALIKVSVTRTKIATNRSNEDSSNFSMKARQAMKNFGILVPVLGFTWIFGILSINEDTEMFQYLFTISSSLQGLLIFLVHVPLNKKLRAAFTKKYGRKISFKKKPILETSNTGNTTNASSDIVLTETTGTND